MRSNDSCGDSCPRLSAGRSPAAFGITRLMWKRLTWNKLAAMLSGVLLLCACSPRDVLSRRLAADLIVASETFRAPQQFTLQTGVVSNKDYLSPEYLVLQHHGWISATSTRCPADVTQPPCWDVLLTPSGVDTVRPLVSQQDTSRPSFA